MHFLSRQEQAVGPFACGPTFYGLCVGCVIMWVCYMIMWVCYVVVGALYDHGLDGFT